MSAPMTLTPDQLASLAEFLRAVTAATREHGVTLNPYDRGALQIGDAAIRFEWRDDDGYVLADSVGD